MKREGGEEVERKGGEGGEEGEEVEREVENEVCEEEGRKE